MGDEITITSNIIIRGVHCFDHCKYLKRAVFPNDITRVPFGIFANCVNFTDIELPESILTIKDEAFMNTGLVAINLPSKLQSIEFATFKGCYHLKNISFGKNITFIGASCFENALNFSSVILPPKITSISGNCFKNASLASLEIPESVTTIGVMAFEDCHLPEKLTISAKIYNVDVFAFHGSKNLKVIHFLGITNIAYSGFLECQDLVEVLLPQKGRIGYDCFKGCKNLKIVRKHMTSGYNELGFQTNAFQDCINLQEFPFSYTYSINDELFKNCINLQNLDLEKTRYIGSMAFYNCSNLTYVHIADNAYVEYASFQYCVNLKYVYLGKFCKLYPDAFSDCYNIKFIIIDSSTILSYYTPGFIRFFSTKTPFIVTDADPNQYIDVCIYLINSASKLHFVGLEREYLNETCSIPMLPVPSGLRLTKCQIRPETLLHERDYSRYHFEFMYLLSA